MVHQTLYVKINILSIMTNLGSRVSLGKLPWDLTILILIETVGMMLGMLTYHLVNKHKPN